MISVLVACLATAFSCSMRDSPFHSQEADPYYLDVAASGRETLRDLFTLLAAEEGVGEERFTVVREIANELLKQEKYAKLAQFLTVWVADHPDDPYNAYLLLMTAYIYLKQDAEPMAAYYFDRIIKNYPDLMVRGESVHLACLKKLIEFEDDPEQRVAYYQDLISRFPENIDLGSAYFMLAQSYERTGDWDLAIRAYTKFLPFFESSIPGFPDAFGYAKKIVDFYNSPKDWSFESLSALREAVSSALEKGSSANLKKCRAKVNFFAMSWEQDAQDSNSLVEFNFSDFMAGNKIRYATDLDASSNANEAYLKTWGWSQRISTWYLYFRKINFPADPEIHGRWEWAGIYYGEKF
ncbi:MAG: hypothetical protein A2Z99_12635 [Treponema sp. GWB1_62_6]|nr:MAG: hypothetical protein A2Y36_09715 [Treponema sp. GWA1_62_8]OHE64373.1 MAG: hypothetical protein A2001_05565 [Treponema sp. GWC1_61_84]OHE70453.1 MAG: hypothetical protein A2Z99_12635 [Treponema sp. GWB1_62_6]HCM27245.1 tetratricopeptide repeat protein [Treponema sp.]